MAKGKLQNLSADELLKQALVPENEQPYDVPANWVWVRLGYLGYTNIGLTYKPSDVSTDGVIVLRSSNIQNGVIDYNDIVKVNLKVPDNKMSQRGDILICARNGSKALVGKTAIIDANGMSYGAFMAIFRSEYNRLIYYYLNSSYFRDLIDREVGSTTINQVTQSMIKELPFPFPPLAEQQRIVERIESLFAKLDQAKELAQNALDSFETRKAAILHKAFTGKLTAKWRDEHGVGMDSWVERELISVFKFIDYRGKTPTKTDDGVPLVTAKNVKKGYIDYSIRDYISADEFEERKSRGVANKGDILFTTEAPLGNVAIADIEMYSTGQRLIVLQQNGSLSLSNKFVMYYMLTSAFQSKLDDQKTGSTVAGIKASKLKQITVVLPSLLEQKEIERILDRLFDNEQKAKELIDIIESIDILKKALLARAFRGELGTNDSGEKNAFELLKEVVTQ